MKNISIENWAQDETLTVGNDEFFYTATTAKSPVEAAATQFADFADWSARLNAAYPPKQPPYIRIRFNRLLAEHGVLPQRSPRRFAANRYMPLRRLPGSLPMTIINASAWLLMRSIN